MKSIKYADKTAHWEDWWHRYKYGAFYIFPPEEIMQTVDKLRQKYDPKSASFCRAHISLSEPLMHEITESEINSLKKDLESKEKFEINYGPIITHPPYPGVTYNISNEANFSALRKIIHSNIIFNGVKIKKSEIVPHMTIAEFITMERTHQIFEELKNKIQSGNFVCDTISLAVPNNDFYFDPVLSFSLGKIDN